MFPKAPRDSISFSRKRLLNVYLEQLHTRGAAQLWQTTLFELDALNIFTCEMSFGDEVRTRPRRPLKIHMRPNRTGGPAMSDYRRNLHVILSHETCSCNRSKTNVLFSGMWCVIECAVLPPLRVKRLLARHPPFGLGGWMMYSVVLILKTDERAWNCSPTAAVPESFLHERHFTCSSYLT